MLEKILEGLSWGLFVVATIMPVAIFSVIWSWLAPLLRKPKEEEKESSFLADFEDPPSFPDNYQEDMPTLRFVPSTIVRPPRVVKREDIDDDD